MLERARRCLSGLSVGDAFGEQFLESGSDFHAHRDGQRRGRGHGLQTRERLPDAGDV